MNKGIAIVGNLIVDHVKLIDNYPAPGMLTNIRETSKCIGGCAGNTAADIAKIDPELNVVVIGKVGNDADGDYVKSTLSNLGVDIEGVITVDDADTSYTDVMSDTAAGERTFFQARGANAKFSISDIDFERLNVDIFHIGYALLLDEFDKPDAEYGTVMARFLKKVQDLGIKTSIDVVSDSGARFAEKVIPALKYTDNAIMNEIEGCGVSGLKPRDESGRLIIENIKLTLQKILDCGVRERAIIHCPEAGFVMNKSGEFITVPSLKLPKGYIKGSVGAGDAFCAGCLYGIYNGLSDRDILEFASGAAACNLAAADSVSGMQSKEYILDLIAKSEKVTL